MAVLCCIYTGWLDVVQPETWIAHTAVCSAPQQTWLQTLHTLHQTHSWDLTTFMVELSAEVTFKLILWAETQRLSEAQCVWVCVSVCSCEGQRELERAIGDHIRNVFLVNPMTLLAPKWVRQSATVSVRVCKYQCVPRPLLWSPHRLWFCRFDCGRLIWSPCCLLRPRADAGPDTFADSPARKTFMMKCEAGKREVRTNREAVFFKPLFYFANQCPESTFGCHCKHVRGSRGEWVRVYARVCMVACLIAGTCIRACRQWWNICVCACMHTAELLLVCDRIRLKTFQRINRFETTESWKHIKVIFLNDMVLSEGLESFVWSL